MLTFILGGIAFNKANMSTHFITIISEIYKFAKFISGMRFMGSKDCNNRVGAYAIEGGCITGDYTFQGVVLHNTFLECLFVLCFSGHRRLRYNYSGSSPFG